MSASQKIACFDVGASFIKGRGYLLRPGHLPESCTREWRAPVTPKGQQDFTADFDNLLWAFGMVGTELDGICDGISLGVAGLPTADGKSLARAGNITDWVGKPFVAMLEDKFGLPVTLANDAQASLAADLSSVGAQGALGLYVGTGLGVAISLVLDGKLFILPGEGSHGTVDAHRVNLGDCGCRQLGGPCVESHGSGRALELDYKGKPASQLTDGQVSRSIAPSLATLARNVINLLVPRIELVVVGGGIAAKRPQLVADVRTHLMRQLNGAAAVKVQTSPFGEETGPYGAATFWQITRSS